MSLSDNYLGRDIPKLGFGLMRLPQIGESIDVEQTKAMVDAFLEAGGTYFDTARAYGESESAIRKALVERYPRERFYLATKNAAWLGAADEVAARKLFDTSLEETGAGYFDFYLLHNLGGERTQVFDKFHLWEFAQELKAAGRVRHVGFSMHDNAEVLDELLTAHPEMEFVQLQVNYADWESGAVQSRACCEVAARHGKPIIIMEPVRGGTLANPPAPVADILREADPEASFVSWALRFAMGVPGIITVLSGMSSLEQMLDNIKIWKSYQPLTESERATLERAQAKLHEITVVPCTGCHYCMPGCPEGINISDIMDCLNVDAIYGHEAGLRGYGFAAPKGKPQASDCIQCGQCEEACPQAIPIINNLEQAADLFE